MRGRGLGAGHHLVTFRQLVEWPDAQDPAVLAQQLTLGIGQAPTGRWTELLA